jgi:murein L,D-transpeptidase YafK
MYRILFFIFIFLPFLNKAQSNFKTEQKLYERVKTAYLEKEDTLIKYANSLGFTNLQNDILIIAFKQERKLEVWAKNKDSTTYSLFKTYNFAGFSGQLGPKRLEGDFQIPEGFYNINFFNPSSSYYLSLKVSYPNASDKILSDKSKPGGDIYIHGNSCTIGCIPITDDKIKELYLLCIEAINSGQTKIPVYIFPAKLDDGIFFKLKQEYKDNQELIKFWENLKIGYDIFIKNKKELIFTINSEGTYIF